MKLGTLENLYDNMRTITVFIKSFGDRNYSIEEEKAILDDFKPSIQYKDIDFSGYYKKVGDEIKKVESIITYKYLLNIVIPNTYTVGSGVDEKIVTIGNNNISFTTTEVEGSNEFINIRNQAISDFVKADSNLINIFDVDSINIENDKIVVEKILNDKISIDKIDNVNDSYGENSISVEETSNQEGFPVSINVVNKKIEIKEGLECTFSFENFRVKESELYGQDIDTICEAKVLLFADCVEKAIIDKVKECKHKLTNFEHKDEVSLESEEF